jgi:hypothetical protein
MTDDIVIAFYTGESMMDAIEVIILVNNEYYINCMTESYMVVKGQGQFTFNH